MSEPTSELSLELDQLIDARPATVFRLLTEPDLYARWFGPEGATTSVEQMEVMLGGRLEVKITFPGMNFEVRIEGFYEVIEPPVRLVHTWRSMDEELVTTVAFDLEPQGNRTRLPRHPPWVRRPRRSRAEPGWMDRPPVDARHDRR